MILPGATLGMLGGGQLGRMFVTAAQTMGYKVIVLEPDANSPAGIIADQHICAAYTDETALAQLAEQCDAQKPYLQHKTAWLKKLLLNH